MPRRRRRKDEPPGYKVHKATGQAYYFLGKRHYLGKHGPESRAAYRAFLDQWEAAHRRMELPRGRCTVTMLVAAFLDHAAVHYRRPDGRPTDELRHFAADLRPLLDGFGALPVDDFRPRDLKAIRDAWVRSGLARKKVNQKVGRVKRAFNWGVEEELVQETTAGALSRVKGLSKGRTTAPDREPVRPVPEEDFTAAVKHLETIGRTDLSAMLWTGYLCGARPGEVCAMKADEVDRAGRVKVGSRTIQLPAGVWAWQPGSSKTHHHGKTIVYHVGPKLQTVLAPFLVRASGYVFPSTGRGAKRAFRREEHYSSLIREAATAAGVDPWSPGRLRHNFLERMDRAAGLEAASILVGHANLATSELYIERDLARAAQIAARLG